MSRFIPCECGGWAKYRRSSRNDGMTSLECNKCGGVFELGVPWNENKYGYSSIKKSASTETTGLKTAGWWAEKKNQIVVGYAAVGGLVGMLFLGLWGLMLGAGLGWFIGAKVKDRL